MARYDANGDRGHHYGLLEPGYGGPKHAVIGYSATSQSYATTHEQVVQYGGGFPGRHSAPSMELLKNIPRVGDISLLQAALGMTHIDDRSSHNEWPSHQEQPKKGDHISSPRFSQPNGSPRNKVHRDHSPPSRDHHYGKYKNFSSNDNESDEDDDHNYERQKPKGYPHGGPHSTHPKQDPYHEKPNGHGYSPHSYIVPVSTHPNKSSYHETSYNHPHDTYNERPKSSAHSPPSYIERPKGNDYSPPSYNEKPKGTFYGPPSYNEKPKDGVYSPPSYNERPNSSVYTPPSYNERPNGSVYSPPSYNKRPNGSVYSPPSYNEKPKDSVHSPHSYSERPKGSDNPHSYSVHGSSHPKNDQYHETSYTVPYHEKSTDRPMVYNPPPPIMTTIKGGGDYLGESPRNSPVAQRSPFGTSSPRSPFTSSPRKVHGRYEQAASPRFGAPAAEEYRVSTIDSEEAARKYNGIFVKMK